MPALAWTRAWLRARVPYEARLALALARRTALDRLSGVRFAERRAAPERFPAEWSSHTLPIADYPGQEAARGAKRHNIRLFARALDCVVLEPGETLSLWRLGGRPSAERGYQAAGAIRAGVLMSEIGGSTCLVSTVLYKAGLLAGLDVTERRNHSVDTYGESRYYELGLDATIEHGYIDLRFRNPLEQPLLLRVRADDEQVTVSFHGWRAKPFDVAIEVVPRPAHRPGTFCVETRRTVAAPGAAPSREQLGPSCYRTADAL